MTAQFVETIKIKDGKAMLIPLHQARLERTVSHFFPLLAASAMPHIEDIVKPTADMTYHKARVVYGETGVEHVEYTPYSMRRIRSLKAVHDDKIDYSYKSTDRTRLNELREKRGDCDEIIIVKNGLVTDTSFTNLAIFNGFSWLTPRRPLLAGTKRAWLLQQGIIKEADITLADLLKAPKVNLFNSMIDFGEMEISKSMLVP